MFTLIYNPVSGNGKVQKLLPQVTKELNARKITFKTLETTDSPSPEYYAVVPCSKSDTVCIAGGDGTVLEVLNYLPKKDARLIIVPCGTGNDFVKCVRLPKNPIKALIKQLDSDYSFIDYAYANDECFLNVFGIGFDVEVLKELYSYKSKYVGLRAYLKALVKAIGEYKPTTCLVSVDDDEPVQKTVSILSVGNGQYIGGGMKAVPYASPSDGYFDVVEVKPVKKSHLLMLLPAFVFGLHIKVGLGKTYRCKRIVLCGKGLSYQIDGEVRSADRIEIKIVEKQLQFYCQ